MVKLCPSFLRGQLLLFFINVDKNLLWLWSFSQFLHLFFSWNTEKRTHYLELRYLFTGIMWSFLMTTSTIYLLSLGHLSIWVSSRRPHWQLPIVQTVHHSRGRWCQSRATARNTLSTLLKISKGCALFKAVTNIWLLIRPSCSGWF